MSKTLCNFADCVYKEAIQAMTPDTVIFKPGCSWKRLTLKEKPKYSDTVKPTDAGPLREETVTLETAFNADPILRTHPSYGLIFRLYTDDGHFLMGSDRYPCTLERSADRIRDVYTFTCQSPA
jgi:hypothetical protein